MGLHLFIVTIIRRHSLAACLMEVNGMRVIALNVKRLNFIGEEKLDCVMLSSRVQLLLDYHQNATTMWAIMTSAFSSLSLRSTASI